MAHILNEWIAAELLVSIPQYAYEYAIRKEKRT